VESYGVEFMVPHDDARSTFFHHPERNRSGADIVRSAVDEIAHENGLTGGMAIGATRFSVAHFFK
jgi:hypothetical protein